MRRHVEWTVGCCFRQLVSSEAASSRCPLGTQRQLSPLLSLRGWTAKTASSPARLRAFWTDSSRCLMLQRGSSATGGSMTTSHRSSAMFSTGCQSHSASNTSSVYSSFNHYTELLHSTCIRDCCIGTRSSASGLRLRSLEETDLRVRRMRTHFGDRAFSVAGLRCWNNLPPAFRFADSLDSFKVQLKLSCSLRLILFSCS